MIATILALVLALLVATEGFREIRFGVSPILIARRDCPLSLAPPIRKPFAGSFATGREIGRVGGYGGGYGRSGRCCSSLQSAVGVVSGPLRPPIEGLVAGGFHAITGPDHFAAIAAACVGKSTLEGFKLGALWGAGHGLALVSMGGASYFLKDQLAQHYTSLYGASHFTAALTGLSLVIVGLLGVKDCLESDGEEGQHANKPNQTAIALLVNGVIHGLCLSGLPGLIPAMAMPSWKEAMFYLGCYALGTVGAMSFIAAAISCLSAHVGKMTSNPRLLRRLPLVSSLLAVGIGLWWGLRAWTGR